MVKVCRILLLAEEDRATAEKPKLAWEQEESWENQEGGKSASMMIVCEKEGSGALADITSLSSMPCPHFPA